MLNRDWSAKKKPLILSLCKSNSEWIYLAFLSFKKDNEDISQLHTYINIQCFFFYVNPTIKWETKIWPTLILLALSCLHSVSPGLKSFSSKTKIYLKSRYCCWTLFSLNLNCTWWRHLTTCALFTQILPVTGVRKRTLIRCLTVERSHLHTGGLRL